MSDEGIEYPHLLGLQKNIRRCHMANVKSAKKRISVSRNRAERNKAIKSEVKTYVKKVDAAIASGDKQAAAQAFKDAEIKLTKAASKGVFHKNTVSRKIGRLAKAVDAMA